MKKNAGVLFAALFAFSAFSLNAEANREPDRAESLRIENTGRVLYEISAENEASASGIERELQARFEVYNRLFRFDPAALPAPLKVRVFDDKAAYDSYIAERLGETKPGAVYLHYNRPGRRELVIHRLSPEGNAMLAHQAFIQYFRAFIANPPSWMREGFAIFFSTLRFNPPEKLDYEENLLWLESVKNLGERMPSPAAIFTADISGYPEEFQIASWALVSFLLNGGRDYFRTLTDCFLLLSPDATAAENTLTLGRRVSLWNDSELLANDFKNYLASRKTFKDLMEDGHRAYSSGDVMNAELSFLTAMDQRPQDFAPYYYLGLISYEGKNYDMAEQYYLASRERGADEALINYALGINAAAAERGAEAADFLNRAAAADPAKYRTRVEELLKRIQNREP